MKKNQILVMVLFALAINVGNVLASENAKDAFANQSLSDRITREFYSSPLEDLLDKSSEGITVVFNITQDHRFELIKIEGKNKDLVRYATNILANKKIKIDASITAKSYILPIKFINRSNIL